jgi:hypothetical protein
MRSGLSQAQEQALVRPAPDIMPPPAAAPTTKEIPYDYVAKFLLKGQCGNRVQDVINISVEGGFVAVAIGYSFIPGPLLCSRSGQSNGQIKVSASSNLLGQLLAIVQAVANPEMLALCFAERLCGIHFKYSIVDSGTGRELQNQAIHNIAGLGEPTGDRPFRPFAKPMLFMPRSTIRIEVEEISQETIHIGAELYIVLHGYKILGYGTALP